MSKVIINNQACDYDVAVNLMDDDIREYLHDVAINEGWGNQQFVDEYIKSHKTKFDEDFLI